MGKQELLALKERLANMPSAEVQKELDKLSKADFDALVAVNSEAGKTLLANGKQTLNALRAGLMRAK